MAASQGARPGGRRGFQEMARDAEAQWNIVYPLFMSLIYPIKGKYRLSTRDK